MARASYSHTPSGRGAQNLLSSLPFAVHHVWKCILSACHLDGVNFESLVKVASAIFSL